MISFETNTAKANAVIISLGNTLRTEKDALENVHTSNQSDNSELNTSISSKIEKLQDDLAIESKIMDALASKTTRVKVLSAQLTNANLQIDEIKFEKADMKSCIADVNSDGF